MTARIFTPEVLAAIPGMVANGMSSQQIADRIGSTKKSLIARCSQNGISLRRPCYPMTERVRLAQERQTAMSLRVTAETVNLFNAKAERMGTTPANIIQRLLELIAKDDLVEAVLDGTDA